MRGRAETRHKTLFPLVIILCFLQGLVVANTEIVNFAATLDEDHSILEAAQWPVLHPGEAQRRWTLQPAPLFTPLRSVCEPSTWQMQASDRSVTPCPHELWMVLDLDREEWQRYSRFTFRISWPASSPADFMIETFSPAATLDQFPDLKTGQREETATTGPETSLSFSRRKYARVRLIATGIVAQHTDAQRSATEAISFNVILEPLYFGFVPASVVPVIHCLLLFILGAVLVANKAHGWFELLAMSTRKEFSTLRAGRKYT